jgi:hypothetical protein
VLTGHKDPKVHQRYIASTITAWPEAAMPTLPETEKAWVMPFGRRDKKQRAAKPATRNDFSERDTGLEPATLSLGS